ncbi:MAG: radical SAM protein, partial [Myxococcales bacterium]|nr:radical SAM protein [Myxococcales bacterium]
PDGTLLHTGHAAQVDMNELEPVDWSLSDRIEPFVDMKEIPVATWVETQRGCVFKCEFCDYRTIQTPAALSIDKAIDAIFNAAVSPKGMVRITDSTATFPRARWEAIMQGVIDRGGSPVPLWCFARVNDLNETATELMGKANVRHVFVGQESGDQRILQEMRKGTSVKHVRPAIDNLGRNGINGTFSFIHGFPGENAESIANTRAMICGINDGFERTPVVLQYLAQPLVMFELSAVSQREDTKTSDHWMDYDAGGFTPTRAMEEILETIIAVSRIPHAPVYLLMPGTFIGNWEEFYFFSPHRYEIFRWLKAVERGIAIFLERALHGTAPNMSELAKARDIVLSHLPPASFLDQQKAKTSSKIQRYMMGRMVDEWDGESKGKVGLLTRGLVAASVFRDIGRPAEALRAAQQASYPDIGSTRSVEIREQNVQHSTTLDRLAAKLVDESLGATHRERQRAAAQELARSSATPSK